MCTAVKCVLQDAARQTQDCFISTASIMCLLDQVQAAIFCSQPCANRLYSRMDTHTSTQLCARVLSGFCNRKEGRGELITQFASLGGV